MQKPRVAELPTNPLRQLVEVLVGELRQDRGVDLVVAKYRLIPLQAETAEPSRDVYATSVGRLVRI
jgi:hypothetical protein